MAKIANEATASEGLSVGSANVPSSVPTVQRRSRLGLIYFALAAFDVLAICAGLFLSHQIMSIYVNSVTVNQEWAARLRNVSQLSTLAQITNAPGNDVFDSRDPIKEKARLDTGLTDFSRHMRNLREDFKNETDSSLISAMDRIDEAMTEMVKEAELIFSFFATNNQASALDRMATMDRKYGDLTREVSEANTMIQQVQSNLFSKQLAEAISIRQYEYGIGALILLMVCGVMIYGHRMSRIMTKSDNDIRDYARQLHMAHDESGRLNSELAKSLRELEEAHAENVRKGKLAQLGQLTATVAHEIRNPLGAVKTAAYLIDRKTKDKNLGIEGPMLRINNGIQRCDTIITELLDFTRSKALDTTAQSVDAWVEEVVEEERRSLSQEVNIIVDLNVGAEPILFDSGRLRRVLINLLSNSAEAMVGKGNNQNAVKTINPTITISTRFIDGMVEIVCADNGPGISPENLAKIREPLFTTKSFGVGLGIPAVEKILEQHDGGLKIESVVGHGATVTAWFPMKFAAKSTSGSAPRKAA